MKNKISVLILVCMVSGCNWFSTPAPATSPLPTTAERTLDSVETLPDGGGVNCHWSDGTITHHSDAAHCGK